MKQLQVKASAANGLEVTESNCYIFVPSVYEMDENLANTEPYPSEIVNGTTISHFINATSRICYNSNGQAVEYWTRSASNGYTTYFYKIKADGSSNPIGQANGENVYARIMIGL